ncbi:tripartite tricarboxylate transporter TctB family protein [Nesterenkonia muleiensis]|uniref:tripartite tricarboxylate transporter TctB family protein n=1 Tax=Nesterenkonia muleiensis TaxID=2282648 RepID=UPI000E74BC94|nr:tripartite tricarboxylate transporter TctB family protein [Nesterenkonia muleiensis]
MTSSTGVASNVTSQGNLNLGIQWGELLIGIATLVFASIYFWQAFQLPAGSQSRPGPGIYPLLIAILLIISSILVIVQSFIKKDHEVAMAPLDRDGKKKIAKFFLSTVIYILLLPALGNYIAGTLYVSYIFFVIGNLNIIKSIAFGAIISVTLSYIVIEFLGVRFPQGFW